MHTGQAPYVCQEHSGGARVMLANPAFPTITAEDLLPSVVVQLIQQ